MSLYSIDWLVFINEMECVYCAVRSTFYVLPTQCICVDLRINSDYVTVQHWLTGFYKRDGVCLLRGTFYILRSAHTVYLCVLCGSENKQRLFYCTALTDWLVFITETDCVYCAVRSTFYVLPTQCILCGSENKQRLPHILESNPHPFYSFRGLKNQMRITIACGLDSRSTAGFWKNDGAAVRAVRTIQYSNYFIYY